MLGILAFLQGSYIQKRGNGLGVAALGSGNGVFQRIVKGDLCQLLFMSSNGLIVLLFPLLRRLADAIDVQRLIALDCFLAWASRSFMAS